ncbi:hypothetical protein ZIOFF_068828 [Zingiber officinale]|uniref:Uncharacterized protein n=1 Tax=Zingiber officinale TaxID=94328 RepID=A0A8J5CAZ8_ZINOF|nr:hypothetical protein ZIOFF_068828 [Zingiber officinale]
MNLCWTMKWKPKLLDGEVDMVDLSGEKENRRRTMVGASYGIEEDWKSDREAALMKVTRKAVITEGEGSGVGFRGFAITFSINFEANSDKGSKLVEPTLAKSPFKFHNENVQGNRISPNYDNAAFDVLNAKGVIVAVSISEGPSSATVVPTSKSQTVKREDKLYNFLYGLQPSACIELRRQNVKGLASALVAVDALVDLCMNKDNLKTSSSSNPIRSERIRKENERRMIRRMAKRMIRGTTNGKEGLNI